VGDTIGALKVKKKCPCLNQSEFSNFAFFAGLVRGFGYTVSRVFYIPRYSVFFGKNFRYRVFCITITLGICYQSFCIFKVYWYPRGTK